uniref:ANK_REP_REGION domain-containing protein n=1 Tax=Anopheles maculatus TaxID=74869 RepID=A0A182SQA4_9DIPT
MPTAHCTLVMNVLSRWKKIAVLEKLLDGETPLSYVLEKPTSEYTFEAVGKVLDIARGLRKLEGLVLGGIAIVKATAIAWYGSDEHVAGIAYGCNLMARKVIDLHDAPGQLRWQSFTMKDGTACAIKFSVLGTTNENREHLPTNLQIWCPNLTDSLLRWRILTDELFGKHSIVYATLSIDSRTLNFFRIGGWCCAYDLCPPHSVIDLSSMVNTTLWHNGTILHKSINECTLDTIKLLVENGANPLLTDYSGDTALYNTLKFDQPTVTLYLLQMCKEKNFRNENGCSIEEITVGRDKKRLLDVAIECITVRLPTIFYAIC